MMQHFLREFSDWFYQETTPPPLPPPPPPPPLSPLLYILFSLSLTANRHFSFSVPFQNWSATFLTSPSYLRYDFSPEVKQAVKSVWTLLTLFASALNDYYYYYLFGEGREFVPRVSKHFQIRNVAVRLYWKCPGPNNLCTVNLCVCNLQSTLD